MLTLHYHLPWLQQPQWLVFDAQGVVLNREAPRHIDTLAVMSPVVIVLRTSMLQPAVKQQSQVPASAALPQLEFLWLWRIGFQPAHWSALRQWLFHSGR